MSWFEGSHTAAVADVLHVVSSCRVDYFGFCLVVVVVVVVVYKGLQSRNDIVTSQIGR